MLSREYPYVDHVFNMHQRYVKRIKGRARRLAKRMSRSFGELEDHPLIKELRRLAPRTLEIKDILDGHERLRSQRDLALGEAGEAERKRLAFSHDAERIIRTGAVEILRLSREKTKLQTQLAASRAAFNVVDADRVIALEQCSKATVESNFVRELLTESEVERVRLQDSYSSALGRLDDLEAKHHRLEEEYSSSRRLVKSLEERLAAFQAADDAKRRQTADKSVQVVPADIDKVVDPRGLTATQQRRRKRKRKAESLTRRSRPRISEEKTARPVGTNISDLLPMALLKADRMGYAEGKHLMSLIGDVAFLRKFTSIVKFEDGQFKTVGFEKRT
jgi:chromosome segregation ATPase